MAAGSAAISYGVQAQSLPRRLPVLLGRFLFVAIFLMAGANHFSRQTIAFAASQGVPLASVTVPFSGILALAGGLSILLGYRARLGAWLIALFLVPVTLMMHKFWAIADPDDAANPDDTVHEKRCDSRWSIAHFTVRGRTVES